MWGKVRGTYFKVTSYLMTLELQLLHSTTSSANFNNSKKYKHTSWTHSLKRGSETNRMISKRKWLNTKVGSWAINHAERRELSAPQLLHIELVVCPVRSVQGTFVTGKNSLDVAVEVHVVDIYTLHMRHCLCCTQRCKCRRTCVTRASNPLIFHFQRSSVKFSCIISCYIKLSSGFKDKRGERRSNSVPQSEGKETLITNFICYFKTEIKPRFVLVICSSDEVGVAPL